MEGSSIDFAAMAYCYHQDNEALVLNGIQNPVVAHSGAVDILGAGKFYCAFPRIEPERLDFAGEAGLGGLVEFPEGTCGGRRQLYLVPQAINRSGQARSSVFSTGRAVIFP